MCDGWRANGTRYDLAARARAERALARACARFARALAANSYLVPFAPRPRRVAQITDRDSWLQRSGGQAILLAMNDSRDKRLVDYAACAG